MLFKELLVLIVIIRYSAGESNTEVPYTESKTTLENPFENALDENFDIEIVPIVSNFSFTLPEEESGTEAEKSGSSVLNLVLPGATSKNVSESDIDQEHISYEKKLNSRQLVLNFSHADIKRKPCSVFLVDIRKRVLKKFKNCKKATD